MRPTPTPNGIRRLTSVAAVDRAIEAVEAAADRLTPTQLESLFAAAAGTAERLTAKADAEAPR